MNCMSYELHVLLLCMYMCEYAHNTPIVPALSQFISLHSILVHLHTSVYVRMYQMYVHTYICVIMFPAFLCMLVKYYKYVRRCIITVILYCQSDGLLLQLCTYYFLCSMLCLCRNQLIQLRYVIHDYVIYSSSQALYS